MNKLIVHLLARSSYSKDSGFTLLELIVAILIVGVLSAIAIPSLLNQSNRAKESEALVYVGSMNTSQLNNYLIEGEFASTVAELNAGIPETTTNFNYSVSAADPSNRADNIATPAEADSVLRPVIGVSYVFAAPNGEYSSRAILCQGPARETFTIVGFSCPPGTSVN